MRNEDDEGMGMIAPATAAGRASRGGSVVDLRMLCDLLCSNSFDPMEFLAGANISPGVLVRTGAFITRRQERDFHSLFAAATRRRPDIWVDSARQQGYTAWGDFGLATITAPTLRHLRELTETRGGGAGRYPVLGKDRRFAGLAIAFDQDFAPGTPGFQFEVVRETIVGVKLYNELWGSKFPFAHIQVPWEVSSFDLSRFIDAPIRYGVGPLLFRWPREFDDAPLPKGDELLHRHYRAQLEAAEKQPLLEFGIEEHVQAFLARNLDSTNGLAEVAAELGLTVRTLQRRLSGRGLTFRMLHTRSRLAKAQWLLRASDAPIGEIALSVGYSELSSFNHAFRRWVGETPRSYRSRQALSVSADEDE